MSKGDASQLRAADWQKRRIWARGAGAETRKQSLQRFDQLLVSGKLHRNDAEAGSKRGKLYYQQDGTNSRFCRSVWPPTTCKRRGKSNKTPGNTPMRLRFPGTTRRAGSVARHLSSRFSRRTWAEPLKVYCSLWLTDLARQAASPDLWRRDFAVGAKAAKWHADLARFCQRNAPRRRPDPSRQIRTRRTGRARLLPGTNRAATRKSGADKMELWRKVVQTACSAD